MFYKDKKILLYLIILNMKLKKINKTHKCKKIETGSYEYRGFILDNIGYYEPDHCVLWEACRESSPNCADFHALTKKTLKQIIDDYLDKGDAWG